MAKGIGMLLILFLLIKNLYGLLRDGMLLYPEFLKTSANIWEGNDYIDYNPDQNHGIVFVEAVEGS